MFYGRPHAPAAGEIRAGKEWKEYSFTFTAPVDNRGDFGIQIRAGGGKPGTLWIDDVRVTRLTDDGPSANMLAHGDWEGSRAAVEGAWTLYTGEQKHSSRATWTLTSRNAASGRQACRLDIEKAGEGLVSCHVFQSGMSCRRGERYRVSVKMKASPARRVNVLALHQGPPRTTYASLDGTDIYESQVEMAASADVHIHSCSAGSVWPRGPDQEPNYSRAQEAIEQTIQADPDALVIPRIGLSAPGWWRRRHPDHCLTFEDGAKEGECPASRLWRRQALTYFRRFVRWCEENYGDRVIGYHPCGQHTGEWFYYGSWERGLSGFSPAMNRGFRRWLRDKYPSDAALQDAWKDPGVTLDSATVPSAEERRSTSLGRFRNPRKERKVIDFYIYKQLAMEQPLERIASVIKQETGGRKLSVLFYGYVFELSGLPHGPQVAGHLAMSRLLDCPDVDILCSPISYSDRKSGGAGMFMTAVDSVADAGKLWLNEDDTRSYLKGPRPQGGFPPPRIPTLQKTQWVHRRHFSHIFPRRMATWYMDLGGTGWLRSRPLWNNIGRLHDFYRENLDEKPGFDPEVAVIVDERSPCAMSNEHVPMRRQVSLMREQFYRLGVPVRMHYLSDLVDGDVPDCEAYIFLNPFWLDAGQRAAIQREINGAAAVFFYGSGFLSDRPADENITDLTGIPVRRIRPGRGRATFIEGDEPLLAGVEGREFGTPAKLKPLWAVKTSGGVRPLARTTDGQVLAGAARTDDGLRVYVGTTQAPARFLRNVVRRSGVELYMNSDDVVEAADGFLGITATDAGRKQVTLRERTTLDSLFEPFKRGGVRQFRRDMEEGETLLLRTDR